MLGQALVFLKAQAEIVRARREGRVWERIVATSPVGPAWHAFMLRSQAYGALREERAGEYIHHVPFQDEAMVSGEERAVRALRAIETGCWPCSGRTGPVTEHDDGRPLARCGGWARGVTAGFVLAGSVWLRGTASI
ncbi:hypothetical protein [Actinomadura sp. 3N508]|uniref:hypothetical protein n=1 Tax=Actinomadura sp. 3N508 TaxID=3375153 RepID=UPI0037A811BA